MSAASALGIEPGFACGTSDWKGEVQMAAPQHTASVMTLTQVQWDWPLTGYDVVGHKSLSYAHCVG